jgi:two-component sensor histidine kinase
LLALWGADDDGVLDSAALLTSELVTNSLRYATPWQRGQRCIHLDVRVDTGCLRVDVRDPDTSVPSSREADEDAEHGRGLAIVAALAKDWGTTPEPDGKRVWFTLALPDSEPS